MKPHIIRSSKHYFNSFANIGKRFALDEFMQDARSALAFYVSYLWNNRIEYLVKDKTRILDIKNNLLNCPAFISTTNIPFESPLSARALKCISTQACGIVRAVIEKKQRLLFVRSHLVQDKKSTANIDKQIANIAYSEPTIAPNIAIELNSICLNLIETNGHFNAYLQCASLGKKYGKFYLPIKFTKASNKWKARGSLLNSFLLTNKSIDLRWKCPSVPRTDGQILGVDTGLNNIAYCSDGQHTPTTDIHGHSLNSIIDKLSNCSKGSKSFKRAQDHRENFVNWSINQLNLSDIKILCVERIFDLRRGKSSSRKMSHFTDALTRKKLVNLALELGVQVQERESAWRSQRCFVCGYVDAANRKKDSFKCLNCDHSNHSDWNASQNATLELPKTYELRHILKNEQSFFFQKNGCFTIQGEELTVPPKTK